MNEPTFTIADDGKSITCHKCGKTSHNANDVAFHYCGKCNLWHDGPNLLNAPTEAAFFEHTAAIGALIKRTMPGGKFFLTTFQQSVGGKVGIDKFGVTVATDMNKDDLLKFLKGILYQFEHHDVANVKVRTE